MQKRVALARALVIDPQIVLFDEPTSGQDPVRKNAILSMIAQYQKRFGFTAVLVSHEIPDVYFISNRILALYDKKIVFEGTPEELDKFDHPFKDEVIQSLEGLRDELSGLNSRRQFNVMYHSQLKHKTLGETYSVAVFSLDMPNAVVEDLGYVEAQQMVHAMGVYIDKHFGAIGGFSTRHSSNEFVTVLPYSDMAEAEEILTVFIKDFQEQGIRDIRIRGRKRGVSGECIEIPIHAGFAQGQPVADLEAVINSAKSGQKEIGRLLCSAKE
jgi:phospholipid/cholesterol/gamma-HCH transport system ATP-binding protein